MKECYFFLFYVFPLLTLFPLSLLLLISHPLSSLQIWPNYFAAQTFASQKKAYKQGFVVAANVETEPNWASVFKKEP